MWPFKKKTNVKSLRKKLKNIQRKEWEKRLDSLLKSAEERVNQNHSMMTVSDSFLRCDYNKDRRQKDIIKDVEKRFKGCRVVMRVEELHGQTIIEIFW